MPRKSRSDAPGAWHHVMNRGGRRGAIFTRDADNLLFLQLLGEVTQELGWEVHAWALMPNHFHLLVRSVKGNLSECMRMLCLGYTRKVNAAHGWDGPMFRGRFRNQRVVEQRYLRHLVAYIHLNPVRARLVRRADEECWTSHRAHLGLDSRPAWLATWMVEEECGSPEQLQAYVRELQVHRAEWPDEMDRETGWLDLPSPARRRFLPTPAQGEPAPPLLEPEQVLARVRDVTGTSLDQLRESVSGPRANAARRFAVWMLARHTTLTQPQIATQLHMRPRQPEAVLYRIRKSGPGADLSAWAVRYNEIIEAARRGAEDASSVAEDGDVCV